MDKNILEAASMIWCLWDVKEMDTLDIYIEMLQYCIYKTTDVSGEIVVENLCAEMKNEFVFQLPVKVICLLLDRLCKRKIVRRSERKYYLAVDLCEAADKIEKTRSDCKAHKEKVLNELKEFLRNSMRHPPKAENLEAALTLFFAKNGLKIAFDTKALNGQRFQNNGADYYISQFILREAEKGSSTFEYLLEMVRGYFISLALSLQLTNISITKSEFKNTIVYLDTRLLLDILGFNGKQAKDSTVEMVDLLHSAKAELCCFDHNFREANAVLSQYRNYLLNPRNTKGNEVFYGKEHDFLVEDIQIFKDTFGSVLKAKGISIIQTPDYQDGKGKKLDETAYVKEEELKSALQNKEDDDKIYRFDSTYDYDIKSISAICRLRNGNFNPSLEKCGHIFVTSNERMITLASPVIKDNTPQGNFPPLITDLKISSLVWLKKSFEQSTYPRLFLIEKALICVTPSMAFMRKFREKVDKLVEREEISGDFATVFLADKFVQKEIMDETLGLESDIKDEKILEMVNAQKARLAGQAGEESREKDVVIKKLRAEANQKKIAAFNSISARGEKAFYGTKRFLNIIFWILFTLILIFAIYILIKSESIANGGFWGILLLVLNIIQIIDFVASKKSLAQKLINILSEDAKRSAVSKEQEKFKFLFDE